MKIISITGTKGKTTVTRCLGYLIDSLGKHTLRVDTDGHYINGRQKSTLEDSRNLFIKAPTVCPGKYLITMKKYFPNFTAILETALGSNGIHGLGYSFHDIGIFTNVFEDHMGMGKIKKRRHLAESKSFIFKRINQNGYAIFNADDGLVCSQLHKIPSAKNIALLPAGLTFKYFNYEEHLSAGGKIITMEKSFIVIKSKYSTKKIVDVRKIYWTFGGFFAPSLYNLMFTLGSIYALNNQVMPKKTASLLVNYKLARAGGRLTILNNRKGVKILVDYAHEKYSLKEVAKLGNKLKKNRLIGVIRLAPDRTDKMIFETGKFISSSYDDLIVYDKIDGINRKRFVGKHAKIIHEVGEVSKIFTRGILSNKKDGLVENIIVEERAIRRASKIARPGDTVIVICGDDHKKTIGYIKKYFRATFV